MKALTSCLRCIFEQEEVRFMHKEAGYIALIFSVVTNSGAVNDAAFRAEM